MSKYFAPAEPTPESESFYGRHVWRCSFRKNLLANISSGRSKTMLEYILSALVFTASQGSSSLSEIDTVTGSVREIALPMLPHNVQTCGPVILAVGAKMMMQNMAMQGDMPGKLAVVDPTSLTVKATAEIGMHPAHVVCNRDATRAYVTLSGEDAVVSVDLATLRVDGRVATGAFPHGLRLSADGRTLYVANVQGHSMSVIDVASLREIARIPLGGSAVQVAPSGRVVYVTLADRNAVGVVDVAARRVLRSIPVGENPAQLGVTPDGAVLVVANQGTQQVAESRVYLASLANTPSQTWIVTGRGPHGVAIDALGRMAFVTNVFSGTLSIIDLKRRRVIRTITVGREPNGVTIR